MNKDTSVNLICVSNVPLSRIKTEASESGIEGSERGEEASWRKGET